MATTNQHTDIGNLIIKQAQGIIKLNGAYKSGKLFSSFKLKITQTDLVTTISITNQVGYASYINTGTYQWKNQKQQKNPVMRKYKSVNVKGRSYPFNKKGIEPIYFMQPILTSLPKLNQIIGSTFSKKYEAQMLKVLKDTLKANIKSSK